MHFDQIVKVTIIIPVYNVEHYIAQCLDSILCQTFNNLEVILVDDGSTDKSIEICKKYMELDSRIKLHTQTNQGSGAARNKGIIESTGKYVLFMDPDDFYYSSESIEKLVLGIDNTKAEMCGGNIASLKNNKIKKKFAKGSFFKKQQFYNANYIPSGEGFFWRFIYDIQFLKKHNLFFPDYYRAQDVVFMSSCFSKKPRILMIADHVYVYRIDYKKINWNERKILDWIKGLRDMLKICKDNQFDNYINFKIKWAKKSWLEIYESSKKLNLNISTLINEINEIVDFHGMNKDKQNIFKPFFQGYYLYPISHDGYNCLVLNSTNFSFDKIKNFIMSLFASQYNDLNYDIVILTNGFNPVFEKELTFICKLKKNISIRFYDLAAARALAIKFEENFSINKIFKNYNFIKYITFKNGYDNSLKSVLKSERFKEYVVSDPPLQEVVASCFIDLYLSINIDKINLDNFDLLFKKNIFTKSYDLFLFESNKSLGMNQNGISYALSVDYFKPDNLLINLYKYKFEKKLCKTSNLSYYLDYLRYLMICCFSRGRLRERYKNKIALLDI